MAGMSLVMSVDSGDVDVVVVSGVDARFIAMRIDDPAVSIVLCGFGEASANHARELAAKLLAAADELSPTALSQQPTFEGKETTV